MTETTTLTVSRVAVLADVQSLFFAAKQSAQSKIAYDRLLVGLANNRALIRAVAYVTQRPGSAGFNDALLRVGYDVRVKELPARDADSSTRWSWASGITVDGMRLIGRVETIVIASVDPTLIPLLEAIRAGGGRVELAGVEHGTPGELMRAADAFIPIRASWMFKEPKFAATTVPPSAAKPVNPRYLGLPNDAELDAEAEALAAREQ